MEGEERVTLRFDLSLDPKHIDALEAVKSLLITDKATGITNESPIAEVFCACEQVGLAVLSSQMMEEGIWQHHVDQVSMGKEIDEILGGIEGLGKGD